MMFSRHTCLLRHLAAQLAGLALRRGAYRSSRIQGHALARCAVGKHSSRKLALSSKHTQQSDMCSISLPVQLRSAYAAVAHLQYMCSSFWPSVTVMDVPAVLKLRTYRMRYRWSAQKWQAGTGDCRW